MNELPSFLLKAFMNQGKLYSNVTHYNSRSLLFNVSCLPRVVTLQCRTTMIIKRRYPVSTYKENNKPRLPKKTFHYILEEDTEVSKPEPLTDIVLTSYVSGYGNPGDIITMKKSKAYYYFLLPGLADYPTPERLEYSKSLKTDIVSQEKQVSPSVELCMKYLELRCFSIVMNRETEWTVEPWHVRASFRKAGVHIMSDKSIELPKQPIKGPNLDLEGKEFSVIITINKVHKVTARCIIHHWSTNLNDRLPYEEDFWLAPKEKIFPEKGSETITDSEPSKTA